MSDFPSARNGSRELLTSIQFEDFDVSWAGAAPRPDLFCFGSDDGRMLLADWQGVVQQGPVLVAPSGEAINGVAFLSRWMSVSTRNEIMVWTPAQKRGDSPMGAPIPFGAHGMIAGHTGHFLAPLGRAGLMSCQPTAGREQAVTISRGRTDDAYFYRLISIPASPGQEIVACAARQGGVAAMVFDGADQRHTLSTLTFDGLDVVDLCSLATQAAPHAAVALGRDGTLIFFHDILRDHRPGTVRYESLKGTAYRVLSARGNLFVLTSEGCYVIARLIEPFLQGTAHEPITPVLHIPMEAVDAGLGNEEWIWVVVSDGVLRFDVLLLDQLTPDGLRQGELREQVPIAQHPEWRERCVDLLPQAA